MVISPKVKVKVRLEIEYCSQVIQYTKEDIPVENTLRFFQSTKQHSLTQVDIWFFSYHANENNWP